MENKHLEGLSPEQVAESIRLHGTNVITPPPRESLWVKFFENFKNPLIRILLVALALSIGIACYEYFNDGGFKVFLEPLGILMAILLATLIGFWLEVNANRKFEILNRTTDDLAVKVRRSGSVHEIPRRDVVVGDIVILDTGDEVPADGRLLDSLSMGVNESSLTGEPLAHKSHHLEAGEGKEATYPVNMVMRGTTVVEGRGIMEVTAVGDATEQGHVYKASTIDTGVKTPLTLQFERLGRLISLAAYGVGAVIILGRALVFDWGGAATVDAIQYALETIMLAVTLIVCSVPEGLPMSITLSLALSMRRMLATNNLVRKMHACETMGATTVICTDKTGTLTQNRMSVADTNFFTIDPQALSDNDASHIIAEGIAVNSTAFLDFSNADKATAVGNPTEGALLLWLHSQGKDYNTLRESARIIDQLAFSTKRKYMATLAVSALNGRHILYVKGAPEIVLSMSGTVAGDIAREDIMTQLLEYQSHAYRTLGFAYCYIDDIEGVITPEGIREGLPLQFIGICAIADPVRLDVPDAIGESLRAGINIKVVTGDTPGTAREIARQVGLWTDADTDEAHISGPDWAALSDEEALQRARKIKIMSRARPTDKSRLVNLLQQLGEVVAVTGDGTNDAPALNAAQVGLAMGDGTSVAKEAGDIIILDNSFTSISKAVMWGRSLYLNIQRFVLFQLTVNIVACLIVMIGAFTGTESPLSVTQMLWVNLIMDTFAALALASLPPTPEVMNKPPRHSDAFIITRPMAWNIIGVGVLFTAILTGFLLYLRNSAGSDGLSPYELTIFFSVFVFMQAWNLFNSRAFMSGHSAFHDAAHSRVFFAVMAVIFIGQFIIVYCGGEMFNVVPVSLIDMLKVLGITSLIMLLPLAWDLLKHAVSKPATR
ncbi:MAG: calcium-translocating P-type ATPase, PMCA-type [Muribaculaceae bacterium]